jgi:hypothetical protein
MEKTLEVLNSLQADGVLARYAIGGAMGAAFYAEPFMTDDLDVFVVLPQEKSGLLILTPIYDALRAKGYREEGAFVNIEGVAVQFLPAYDPLVAEALAEATEIGYGKTHARVLRAEHLAAIAVQTGREKDRHRVALMKAQAGLDMKRLKDILERHGLVRKWREWTQ